jgi:hypothetical protein
MAFYAVLGGPGVDETNDVGIWATTPDGLTLVAREGDLMEVQPGVFRRIQALYMATGSNGEDGKSTSLNDSNDLVLGVNTSIGSVFVKTTIPGIETLPGDRNGDGFVNAADYVVWRKNNGMPDLYNTWRDHFGEQSGPANLALVPEPTTWLSLSITGLASIARRRRPMIKKRRPPVGQAGGPGGARRRDAS